MQHVTIDDKLFVFFLKIYDWKPRIKMSSLYDVFLKLLRVYLTFWDQNIIEFLVNARNQYEHKIARSNPLLKYHYHFSDSFQYIGRHIKS